MDTHQNAPLTPKGRELMVRAVVDDGLTKAVAARQFRTTPKTVGKWVKRFQEEGVAGLHDRSSRPLSSPGQTLPATCAAVEALRRQRHTGQQIANELGISPATVSRILRRLGLNRLSALEPVEPVRRYERDHPGEMIHLDIKKLGRFNRIGHRITGDRTGQSNSRGVGWEYVHVAIDDHSRLALASVASDEKGDTATAFLKAAVNHFRERGVRIERVMTDNGSAYVSYAFRDACTRPRIRHLRTKPYTPRTNGKAERFIQTCLREWAYAEAYTTSAARTTALGHWLHHYNWHRPHSALHSQPPISRLSLSGSNLLKLHS